MRPYLAVDWGTSNLRGWHIGADGRPEASIDLPLGVSRLSPADIPTCFEEKVRPALEGKGLPALLCGMVGSNLGWRAVDYAPCPAGVDDVVSRLATVVEGAAPVRIVPGLVTNTPDVMRGEETQILGWMSLAPDRRAGSYLVCHPGTHSKWARVVEGRIESFVTAMTGELFDILREHSVLARDSVAEDARDFHAGLEAAKSGLALSAHLFTARARVVAKHARPETALSFVSGVLIGSEIGALPSLIGADPRETVHVVGAPKLRQLYRSALEALGWTYEEADGDTAVLAGLNLLVEAGALS